MLLVSYKILCLYHINVSALLTHTFFRLTAFVMKCFRQASLLIEIDLSVLEKSMMWLNNQKNNNGMFLEPGRVSHKAMQVTHLHNEYNTYSSPGCTWDWKLLKWCVIGKLLLLASAVWILMKYRSCLFTNIRFCCLWREIFTLQHEKKVNKTMSCIKRWWEIRKQLLLLVVEQLFSSIQAVSQDKKC